MKLSRMLSNALDGLSSSIDARLNRRALEKVRTFSMFVGYRRSGHSLVGACLDAHPRMCFAHELGVLRYLKQGFSPEQVCHLILRNARTQAQKSRSSTGYQYSVPGQSQGRTGAPEVIGDKQGGQTVVEFEDHPETYDLLRRLIPWPLKFVHVTRNPYDNAAAISVRSGIPLAEAVDSYLRKCRTVQWLSERPGDEQIHHVKLEDFIGHPREELTRLCTFLGQEATEDYLAACAAIVLEKPNLSRKKVEWDTPSRDRIAEGIATIPFLAGYTFTE